MKKIIIKMEIKKGRLSKITRLVSKGLWSLFLNKIRKIIIEDYLILEELIPVIR